MSDFESRLRTRLLHLEAAVPTPKAPVLPQSAARAGRPRFVVLLAAALALLVVTALTAIANEPPPSPLEQARDRADEERLLTDGPLKQALAGCVAEPEAVAIVRRRLDHMGLQGWSVRTDERTSQARCVTVAPIGDSHEVLVLPSMGDDAAVALDEFRARLMQRCASRDEAVAALRAVLVETGWPDPNVEVGGMRGTPIDDGGAYVAHFEAGCAVFAGAQFDHVGRYTWFIAAK